jgi:copper chaperone
MSDQQIRKATLRAQELSCPSCVSKIETSLTRLSGVENAEVHFSTGRIAVEYDAARIATEVLVRAVADAGYVAKVSAF